MEQRRSGETAYQVSARLRQQAADQGEIDVYSGAFITVGILGFKNVDGVVIVDRSAIGPDMSSAEIEFLLDNA